MIQFSVISSFNNWLPHRLRTVNDQIGSTNFANLFILTTCIQPLCVLNLKISVEILADSLEGSYMAKSIAVL